jgi:hypothetical protein
MAQRLFLFPLLIRLEDEGEAAPFAALTEF